MNEVNVPPSVLAHSMPAGWQAVFTLAMVVPTIGLIGVVLRYWRRRGDVIPALCLIGGALGSLVEPMVDRVALCWYPRHGAWTMFEMYGMTIPWLVLPGYTWMMGGFTAIVYVMLRRGASSGDVFRLYGGFILINAAVEIPSVHTGVYYYYGHQPLRIFGWPMWWGFINTAIGVVAGCLIFALRDRLTARSLLLIIPLVPIVDAGVNAGAGFPLFDALNTSGTPTYAGQICGLLTCAMAVLMVLLATRLVQFGAPPADRTTATAAVAQPLIAR